MKEDKLVVKIERIVPKLLLDQLVCGNVVPFVGAGFSRNCEGPSEFVMPNWQELGKRVAADMPDYEYAGSPIDALSALWLMGGYENGKQIKQI